MISGEGGGHLKVGKSFFGSDSFLAGDAEFAVGALEGDAAEGDEGFDGDEELGFVAEAADGEFEAIVAFFEGTAFLLEVAIDGNDDLFGDALACHDGDAGSAVGLAEDLIGGDAWSVDEFGDIGPA